MFVHLISSVELAGSYLEVPNDWNSDIAKAKLVT